MKLRHAAALALLDWYYCHPHEMVAERKADVQLSHWVQLGTFNSAKKCDQALNLIGQLWENITLKEPNA
jgi:hypothetical protein